MQRLLSLLSSGLLLFLALSPSPQRLRAGDKSPDFADLEKVALDELKDTNTPGAAIAIVKGDKIVLAKGFGVASVETGAPATPDMLFRMGSTTKMFTAAAVVMLAEEGKFKLDEPVGAHLHVNDKFAKVTAHQLLTHTAGITDESPMNGSHDDTALAKNLVSLKENYCFTEPGKIFSYSNPGYWLAGVLAEHVSDKGMYADLMNERLFKPLGMKRTTLRPTVAMTYPLAVGHQATGRDKPTVVRPLADNAATWPAGQMFSSVEELARFTIAFMNGGKLDGKEVLSPPLITKLSTPYVDVPGTSGKYGYGLNVITYRGVPMLQHNGSRAGYGSTLRMAPKEKVAVIILCNKTGAWLPKTTEKALELMLPLEPKPEVKAPKPIPMTEEEMTRYAGTYTNNLTTVELRVKDGKLVGKTSAREGEINKLGGDRFQLGATGEPFLLLLGKDGKPLYLHQSNRALKRVEDKK